MRGVSVSFSQFPLAKTLINKGFFWLHFSCCEFIFDFFNKRNFFIKACEAKIELGQFNPFFDTLHFF